MSLLEQIKSSKAAALGVSAAEAELTSPPAETAPSPNGNPTPGPLEVERPTISSLIGPRITPPTPATEPAVAVQPARSRAQIARNESLIELKGRVHEELIRDLD